MLAVCCTESVHYPAVSVRSKLLGEILLSCLHLLLGCLICRIIFFDSYRLAFLLRIVAEVLKKKHLTRLESRSLLVSSLAIRSELYRNTELLAHCVNYLRE